MEELDTLAAALGMATASFFGKTPVEPREEGRVVRKRRAPSVVCAGAGAGRRTCLSPDLTDDFEVVHSTFASRRRTRVEDTRRATQEVGYVVSGTA